MSKSLYSQHECEKTARQASLRYITDSLPGITRKKHGKGFAYYDVNGNRITDKEELKRIRAIGIPPVYHDIWICPFPDGHIQASGRDQKNRKQYCYHVVWETIRQKQKFKKMIPFGQALPLLRQHIKTELDKPITLCKSQMVCVVLYLLENACIRVGSPAYAKENKTYGATTLRKKHIVIESNQAYLSFKGKNSKPWHVHLTNKRIIKILKKSKEIAGYELFKYFDENQMVHVLDAKDINNYLQNLTQSPFTAKDYRTWIACREMLCRLAQHEGSQHELESHILKQTLTEVANILGHTPSICQKNYIYPLITQSWQQGKLKQWLEKEKEKICHFTPDELLLYWFETHRYFSSNPSP